MATFEMRPNKIAQAYGYTSTDAPFAAPFPGVWAKPA